MLTTASLDQYLTWLSGYFMRGGRPTHSYEYQYPDFFYADKVFTVNGECGSDAKVVILANGGELNNPNRYMPFGGLGHNRIFAMDDFSQYGFMWVPIYSNIEFDEYREYVPVWNELDDD